MRSPANRLLKVSNGLQHEKFHLHLFGENIMDKRFVVAIGSKSTP